MCSEDLKVTVDNNKFFVYSRNNELPYVVSRANDGVCCELKCPYCNVCWHTFECTCLDYQIRSIICKHIHYILVKHLDQTENVSNTLLKETQSEEVTMIVNNLNHDSSTSSTQAYLAKKKETIKNSLSDLVANIDNLNYTPDEYNFFLKNINVLKSLGTKKDNPVLDKIGFTPLLTEPVNKKLEKQKTFISTKKKGQRVKILQSPI